MRLLIDFNAETSDGRFFARTSRVDSPLHMNELVQAYDGDDNQLVMSVDELDDDRGLVYLRPDWSTWIDGDPTSAYLTAIARDYLVRSDSRVPAYPWPAGSSFEIGPTTAVHLSGGYVQLPLEDGSAPLSVGSADAFVNSSIISFGPRIPTLWKRHPKNRTCFSPMMPT